MSFTAPPESVQAATFAGGMLAAARVEDPPGPIMIDALFNQPNLLAAKRLMDVSALRHEAIAANLANVETPNYRRIDVAPTFQGALQKAVSARDVASLNSMQPQLAVDASAVSRRKDGNTVDLESEMVRLSRNSIEYGVEAHFITSALMKLRHAITGRSS